MKLKLKHNNKKIINKTKKNIKKSKHNKKSKYNKKSKKSIRKDNGINYKNTYYIDSCFVMNVETNWTFTDRLAYHLRRLGLTPDPLMKQIINNDIKYLKNKKIIKEIDRCISTYNIPMNFNEKLLKPKFMYNWLYPLDNRFVNIKTKLTNYLNISSFNNILLKNELYFNMDAKYPEITKKHMAKTFMIDDVSKYEFPKHYILRPVIERPDGKYVHYYYITFISSENEYNNIIKFYEEHNYGNYIIASEYINNPLLFRGKKCHVRMNYIISVVNNKLNCFLSEKGRIFTGFDLYNTTEKQYSRDVHLSIHYGTINDLIFPDLFTDANLNIKGINIDNILGQMRNIMSCVSSLIDKDAVLLNDNQENGYNVCSVEFLIDQNSNVYLLEINKSSGLRFFNKDYCEFYINYIYDWIAECVLEPCFTGTDPTKHKTYISHS